MIAKWYCRHDVALDLTNVGRLGYRTDMSAVNIAEAKAKLSQLVEQAERGEEVILARHGRPIVRSSEREAERYPQRGLGVDRGRFRVPDDFDRDLPPEFMRYFR
jgi:antitoxin (DNA-binding transcriptional repressor) of toxin-antitoxin stability system